MGLFPQGKTPVILESVTVMECGGNLLYNGINAHWYV